MTKVVKPAAMREGRDIEWLVNWALEKQGLGRSLGGSEVQGRSGDIPTGMRVDGGGYSNDGKWVHDDARVIVGRLDIMASDNRTSTAAALVVHYGRTGTRPDWGSNASGHWSLLRKGNGKAIRRYQDQRKAVGLIGFEWEWVGNRPEDLERMMLEYAAWHAALADLREAINPAMTKYVATGPIVLSAPWDEPERTVHYPAA